MGRSIYAEEVGSRKDEDGQWVHKFWVAVQPSDVSDYLAKSSLCVEQEADIKATVAKLKAEFKKTYNTEYDSFVNSGELNAFADHETPEGSKLHAKKLLASRINLGEHLLQTIENMKAANISEQQLTIEC